MHKRIRLTPLDRQEIWPLYQSRLWKISHLAERYRVSRPTIYNVIKQARLRYWPTAGVLPNNQRLDVMIGVHDVTQ